jgi:hypothetical protein
VVTEVLCPNKQALGFRSTVLEALTTCQIEIVQSVPAVTRVRESTKRALESCPWWICSKRPMSFASQLSYDAHPRKLAYLFAISSIKSHTPIDEPPFHVLVTIRRNIEAERACT